MENATYLTPKLSRHIKNLVPKSTVLDDTSKKLVVSNVGQTIDRMLATNLTDDSVLEELEVILATLADIVQEEGTEDHLDMFATSPHFVKALFNVIDFWRSNTTHTHKYRLHTCYHMSVYLILALVDSARSCLSFAQTVEDEHLFLPHLLRLCDCLKDEMQFTTQQVLVEILVRVYVAYGRKYISNQVTLGETLPKCIGEALQDPSRGPKHVIGDIRSYLNKINAENPNLTSVPIKSLSTITYWMPVQHETSLGQATYIDMGEEVAYILVNKEVDLSIPYTTIQSVMPNDKLRTIQLRLTELVTHLPTLLTSRSLPPNNAPLLQIVYKDKEGYVSSRSLFEKFAGHACKKESPIRPDPNTSPMPTAKLPSPSIAKQSIATTKSPAARQRDVDKAIALEEAEMTHDTENITIEDIQPDTAGIDSKEKGNDIQEVEVPQARVTRSQSKSGARKRDKKQAEHTPQQKKPPATTKSRALPPRSQTKKKATKKQEEPVEHDQSVDQYASISQTSKLRRRTATDTLQRLRAPLEPSPEHYPTPPESLTPSAATSKAPTISTKKQPVAVGATKRARAKGEPTLLGHLSRSQQSSTPVLSPASFVDSSGDLSYIAASLASETKATGVKRTLPKRGSTRTTEIEPAVKSTKPETKAKSTARRTRTVKAKEKSSPPVNSQPSPILDRIPGAHTIPGTALITAPRKRSFGDVLSDNTSLARFRDEISTTPVVSRVPSVSTDFTRSTKKPIQKSKQPTRSASKSLATTSLADKFAAATLYPPSHPTSEAREQEPISKFNVAPLPQRQSPSSSPSPYAWGDEGIYVEEEEYEAKHTAKKARKSDAKKPSPIIEKSRRSIAKKWSPISSSEVLPSQESDIIPSRNQDKLIEQLLHMQKEREARKKSNEIQRVEVAATDQIKAFLLKWKDSSMTKANSIEKDIINKISQLDTQCKAALVEVQHHVESMMEKEKRFGDLYNTIKSSAEELRRNVSNSVSSAANEDKTLLGKVNKRKGQVLTDIMGIKKQKDVSISSSEKKQKTNIINMLKNI